MLIQTLTPCLLFSDEYSTSWPSPSTLNHHYHNPQTCPRNQLPLRQELHWHLGRLALARLQHRLLNTHHKTSEAEAGRTPLLCLAREAADSLKGAIDLALEGAAAAATRKAAASGAQEVSGETSSAADASGMRAREGWARVELAKLCMTGIAPEHVSWEGEWRLGRL